MKKPNKIKKDDFNRILITETLPYETPIIFSNDGLYDKIASLRTAGKIQKLILESLVLGENLPKAANSTIPYLYKIKKNSTEFRRLALIHPMSQWKIKCFYEKYESLILHYCSISPASIRSPSKVASSFYNKSSWENVYKYKTGGVALSARDRYAKHSPSYFSYRGYDRLYKFFDSYDYFSLEKKFEVLLTLDVSKCFDSIYTHSLSWAVKDKQFTKQNVAVSSTFAQHFDSVIRHGNHNETNGIPIGPEVSRIFSEILFQEIDRQTIAKLSKLDFNIDYAFRRYVDDVFIFAKDRTTARLVYDTYSDALVSFNLHANTSKSVQFARPFLTAKSRLIGDVGQATNEFIDKFLVKEGRLSLSPKPIFSPWKLTKAYIGAIKSLCYQNNENYDAIASFLISIFTERIKSIVSKDNVDLDASIRMSYVTAIRILLEIQYFFYGVSPSVSASYKISASIILVVRFFEKRIPEHAHTLRQHIYDLTATLLSDECRKPNSEEIDGFIRLESLNLVLAVRELGDNYLLPVEIIDNLFIKDRNPSYFTSVSCLFYIRMSPQYKPLRDRIISSICKKLDNLSDIFMNSEKAYLLLDMLGCPFIPKVKKENWVKALHKILTKAAPTAVELNAFLSAASTEHWQVDWADVDLLNSLEKKELKQAY